MAGMQEGNAAPPEGDAPPMSAADAALRGTWYREQAIRLALAGRFVESEAWSREALRIRPDDVDAMNELGVALWRQGREAEAEEMYRRAGQIKPDDFRIWTNLGLTLMSQHRDDEAETCFREAIRLQPNAFHAQMNLGSVLSNRGAYDEAIEWLLSSLELCPNSADAVQNFGVALARQGKWWEAIGHYERALRIAPENPVFHRNYSYALLMVGDYARAWPEHEWRLKCEAPEQACRINRTFWNGDDFRDQTVLIHFEQGYGDVLQFIRYARLVKRRGGRVVVLCPPALVRLVSRCEGVDLAFDGLSHQPQCHIQAPMLSLPAIFGTTLETIPRQVPYLYADPVQVEHWRSVLDRATGSDTASGHRPLRVGIAWQGNPKNEGDRWRSYPLAQLAPLAEVPGVQLISLQVGHGTDQIAGLDGRIRVIELPGRRGRDFSETAAIVSLLDLVVAPCSAVTHLAGGLGAPLWVALCAAADWRWLKDRDDSPWYPTARLFRQPKLGDWESVFHHIAEELRRTVARRAHPLTVPADAA